MDCKDHLPGKLLVKKKQHWNKCKFLNHSFSVINLMINQHNITEEHLFLIKTESLRW